MAMREVVSRAYRDAGAGMELYPDLVIVDGGQGQLSAAMDAFDQAFAIGQGPQCDAIADGHEVTDR